MALTLEQQAIELISRAKNILVITKESADTDALASVVAFGLLLKKLNKTFDIVVPGVRSDMLPAFLPTVPLLPTLGPIRSLKIRVDVSKTPLSELMYDVKDGTLELTLEPKSGSWQTEDVRIEAGADRYDLIVAIGCVDKSAMGGIAREQSDLFFRTTVVNVDMNPTNEYWGQVNLVDLKAVSVTDALYRWISGWNPDLIDEQIATALLAGIIAKTQSFRTSNVNPQTLAATSRLIELGAKRDEIVTGLWRTKSVGTLKLWGRALARLEIDPATKLVWTVLHEMDFLEVGAIHDDIHGLVEELLTHAPGANVFAIILPQTQRILTHVHVLPPLVATDIVRTWSGQGTREQATFSLQGASTAEGVGRVVEGLKEVLQKN